MKRGVVAVGKLHFFTQAILGGGTTLSLAESSLSFFLTQICPTLSWSLYK